MEADKKSRGRHLILSEKVFNEVSKILDDLALTTQADLIVFSDINGYPIASRGNQPALDVSAISSLAANNFSATSEMASMIGESANFKFIFHEGEKVNIYISNVDYSFILLVIFSSRVAIGMVRILTNKAIATIQQLLAEEKREEEQTSEFIDLEFKELFDKELEKSFRL